MNELKHELQRVVFYSINDMAGVYHLSYGEKILRNRSLIDFNDINDILELYNIKLYLDNGLYLTNWSEKDLDEFKNEVYYYGTIVGQFMSLIDDNSFKQYYNKVIRDYKRTFWAIVNNYKIYKKISPVIFEIVLSEHTYEIETILKNKGIVKRYSNSIKNFLVNYPRSAEILLSIYEGIDKPNNIIDLHLPLNLTIEDKEKIINNYINNDDCNLNYLRILKNARNSESFRISDKTRLNALKKEKLITNERFNRETSTTLLKYGVSISFNPDQNIIKEVKREGFHLNYSYSSKYIIENDEPHVLFLNFILLFEYLDEQNRIDLVSKMSELSVLERLFFHSVSEYRMGISFKINEMKSIGQLLAYSKIIRDQEKSLEKVLESIFLSYFQEEYDFSNNARLSIPDNALTSYEKLILLAPEFESVLKQYKIFVEDSEIDIDLLQISSSPTSIKDIPSLNHHKYLYINKDNEDILITSNLFFSDQMTLGYIEPFKEKNYTSLFDLLSNEDVRYDSYQFYQKEKINFLINHSFLFIDDKGFIQFVNIPRVLILFDIYYNEVSSYYHYPKIYRNEALQMLNDNMLKFEDTLFSKPEQKYFNYYLNKSKYTNGLDLRNSYLHGTHANREEVSKHDVAYNTYLKLLILALLKIEDDLLIKKFLS